METKDKEKTNNIKPLKKKGSKKKLFFLLSVLVLLFFLAAFFIRPFFEFLIKITINNSINGTVELRVAHLGLSRLKIEDISVYSLSDDVWIKIDGIEAHYHLGHVFKQPLGSKVIKSIEITKPDVLVIVDEKGAVNLAGLLIEKEPVDRIITEPGYAFDMKIYDGKVSVLFHHGNKQIYTDIDSLEGVVVFKPSGDLSGILSFLISDENTKIQLAGDINTTLSQFAVNAKVQNLQGAKWLNLIIDNPDIVIKSGLVDSHLHILGSYKNLFDDIHETVDISGTAQFKNGSLDLKIMEDRVESIDIVLCEASLTKNIIRFHRVLGLYEGNEFNAQGELLSILGDLKRSSLKFFSSDEEDIKKSSFKAGEKDTGITANLYVNIPSLSIESIKSHPLIKDYIADTSGTVSVDAGISGFLSNPKIKGKVVFDEIVIQEEILTNGSIDVTYFMQVVQGKLNNLNWEEGSLQGSFWINTKEKNSPLILDLYGKNADIGRLAEILTGRTDVTVTSDFNVHIIGTVNDPIAFGNTSLRRLMYSDTGLGDGSVSFLFNQNRVFISDLLLSADGGSLSSHQGLIDLDNMYVDISLKAVNFLLPVDLLQKGIDLRFRSDSQARVLGYIDSPLVHGFFNNGSINYEGRSFEDTSGSFLVGGGYFVLSDALTSIGRSKVNLSGWGKLDSILTGQILLNSPDLNIADLSQIEPSLQGVSTKQGLRTWGYLSGSRNLFNWSLLGIGTSGNIAAFGKLNTQGDMAFTAGITGWELDAREFLSKEQLQNTNPGKINISAYSKGSFNDFITYFTTEFQDASLLGIPLDKGRGVVQYSYGKLKLDETYWEGMTKSPSLDGRLSLINRFNLSTALGAETNDIPLNNTFARMYYMSNPLQRVTYHVDGTWIDTLEQIYTGSAPDYTDAYSSIYGGDQPLWKRYVEGKIDKDYIITTPEIFQKKRFDDEVFPIYMSFRDVKNTNFEDGQIPLYNFDIKGEIDLKRSNLDLSVKGSRINMSFFTEHLDLSGAGISLSDIRKTMNWNDIKGDALLEGSLIGYWSSPQWKGRLAVDNGLINSSPFMLSSDFTANNKVLNITSLNLTQAQGFYTGRGTIGYEDKVNLNLYLTAANGNLERLLSFMSLDELKGKGSINGDIQVKGELESPDIDCDLNVSDASFLGQEISSVGLKMKYRSDLIILDHLALWINGSNITGSGNMEKDNLSFSFMTEDFPLSELNSLSSHFSDISGKGSFNLDVKGTRKKPEIRLGYNITDVRLDSFVFSRINGLVNWEDDTLSMDPLSIETIDSYWDLRGSIYFPDGSIPIELDQWIGKKGKPPVFDLKSRLDNFKVTSKGYLEGELEGSFQLQGALNQPQFSLDLDLTDGQISDQPFNYIKSQMDLIEGIFTFNLAFLSPESSVILSGINNSIEKSGDFTLDVKNFALDMLHNFSPAMNKVHGRLSSVTKLGGDYENLILVSNTSLTDGKIGALEFDSLGGFFSFSKGVLSLDDISINKKDHKINFTGTIPLEIKDGDIINPEDVKVNITINENNLDILGIVIPYMEQTAGAIRGSLELSGIYPQLKLNGRTEIRNGLIQLSIMDNPIEEISANILFNEDKMNLKTLQGSMGHGRFNLEGNARFDQKELMFKDLSFLLKGQDLLVMIPKFIRGRVNTQVTLMGDQDNLIIGDVRNYARSKDIPDTQRVQGDFLDVRNATLSLPEGELTRFSHLVPKTDDEMDQEKKDTSISEPVDENSEDDFYLPQIKDFVLTLSDDVWLDYKGLYIKSQGSIKVVKEKLQSVRLFGELDFSRGTFQLPFMAVPFRISSGVVYFDGGTEVLDPNTGEVKDYRMNPIFGMEGETSVAGIDIFLNYEGNLDDLQTAIESPDSTFARINIYSIPPLSHSDIMGLLITSALMGTTVPGYSQTPASPYSLEGTAINMLTGYLQGLIIRDITRTFGRAFSLSELHFEMGASGTWHLRISKALDMQERFFITFSHVRGIHSETIGVWGLEYKYRPQMRLRLESYQGTFIGWIQGQIQFDNVSEFFSEFFSILNPFYRKKTTGRN